MKYIKKNKDDVLVTEAIIRLSMSKDYNSDPYIKDILRKLYHGCCAYCESNPESSGFFDIEHFYPKSAKKIKGGLDYSKYRKDFLNLHYSCHVCNTLKGATIPDEILSPNYKLDDNGNWYDTKSNQISQLMHYKGFLLYPSLLDSKSHIAQNTINLFHLNSRKYLVESRIRRFAETTYIISAIKELMNEKKPENKKASLILFKIIHSYIEADAEYSTMVLQNYGDSIIKLMRIWLYYYK